MSAALAFRLALLASTERPTRPPRSSTLPTPIPTLLLVRARRTRGAPIGERVSPRLSGGPLYAPPPEGGRGKVPRPTASSHIAGARGTSVASRRALRRRRAQRCRRAAFPPPLRPQAEAVE